MGRLIRSLCAVPEYRNGESNRIFSPRFNASINAAAAAVSAHLLFLRQQKQRVPLLVRADLRLSTLVRNVRI